MANPCWKRGLILVLACLLSGCAMVEHPSSAMRRMKRMFTPNPNDWDSESAPDESEWDFVGEEGRGERDRELDPDPWFKRYLMSPQANSIERNLGID
jgi:hypothetical protein